MIPKIFHQTWYKKEIPTEIQSHIDNMCLLHPDFEYRFYDDNDILSYINEKGTVQMINAYNKLSIGAEKADLFRYIVLYYDGGIYLDLDSNIVKNIDNLIKNRTAVITRERNNGFFVQWCLMFSPKHPILKNTIELCIDNINSGKYQYDIHKKTGPTPYSHSIKNKLKIYNIWEMDDETIIKKLKESHNKMIKDTLIFSFDYEDYANFTIPEKDLMYKERKHWRNETIEKQFWNKERFGGKNLKLTYRELCQNILAILATIAIIAIIATIVNKYRKR